MSRLKWAAWTGFCVLFFSLSSAALSVDRSTIGVGTQTIIPARGSSPVTVSNGRVLRAEDLGDRVRLTGRKPGLSAVTTLQSTILVTVLPADAFHSYEKLRVLTSDMQGLEVDSDDGHAVVRGRLLRWSDWQKLATANGPYGAYVFRADLEPSIRDDIQREFNRLIHDAGLPAVELKLTPASVRVSSERADLVSRFEALLKPYGFSVEKTAGVLTLEPLVRVRILVTEVRKRMMRKLGIEWPGTYSANLLPKFSGAPDLSFQAHLNAIEESGAGRILASPNLLCRSGKEAQFLAGGELPIKITANKRQDVVWKKYGVLLKIKPVADYSGRMSIALETEVSTIDTSQTVDGLPGLLTNRIESHFDLKDSRTIALSGLIKHQSGSETKGIPGLSSIPILGSLFSSRDFNDEKTELVVFVTPEVVDSSQSDEP